MNKRFALFALMIPLALTACETPRKRTPVVTPQPMSCEDGSQARITLYSPEDARLVFGGKAYDLDRVITASGVKYENRQISYWNKGIEAMITPKGLPTVICTYVPKSGL